MKRHQPHVDNETIKKHHETFDPQKKIAIDRSADRIAKNIKSLSNGRAKLGEMGALEILYKLGVFMNKNDVK